MKNYRKLFVLLLPFLLMGCSNNNKNKDSDTGKDENCIIKDDVEISFLCMSDGKYNELLKNIIASFKNVEPHVTVNLSNPLGSGNYSNLENIVVSGFLKENYPDIVQCYPDNVVKYIARGFALNLDPYLNNEKYGILGEEKTDYIEAFMNEGRSYTTEGTYSLPFCKSTELLYYHAEALIGIDLSSIDSSINNGQPLDATYLDNLSWEELFDKLCPAIKTRNDTLPASEKLYVESEDSAIFTYDSDENFFITLADQYNYGYTSINENGQGSIDYDNAGMKQLMKKLNSAKKNGFLQTKYTFNDYVSSLFQEKKCLFTVSSTAGLSYNYNKTHPFEIGIARIPHAEGKDYSSINQGPSVCILDHKDENRALAAYLFWKHLTDKTNSVDWTIHTGYMGIRNSSYTSDAYIEASSYNQKDDLEKLATSQNLKKIIDVRESTFNTYVFRGSSNARKNVGHLLRDCLLSADIDAEIDNLFSQSAEDARKYTIN